MKIIELYKHLLAAGNCTVDRDGMVSVTMKDNTMPLLVGGKRMVLPTKDHLDHPDPATKVIFHPLSENILGGESKVMEKFRSAINVRLNWVLSNLMQELMGVVANIKLHPKLSPTQSELLSKVRSVDDKLTKDGLNKTVEALASLQEVLSITSKDKCLVHIFLRRGGRVGGKSFRSAAIVTFPLYEELAKEGKQVFGVTVRAKDKEAIMQLLEFMVPGIENTHSYDRGSECDIAPFLDALMKALMSIAGNINALVDEFENHLSKDAAEVYHYGDEWVGVFDNLAQLLPEIRMIPMQAGNEGHKDRAPAAAPFAPALTNVAPPQPHAPSAQAAHTVAFPAVLPAPGFPVQPGYPAPGYPVHAPVAGPVKTETGKLDFAASLRSNPALAASINAGLPMGPGGYYQPPLPPGPMAARNSAPRWDTPQQFQPMPHQFGQPMMQPQQGYGPQGYGQQGYPQQFQQPAYGASGI